ncbi:uncharacterized protein [Narcine bancroftii]|uniref:uncharacterized protein isoform X2 n=1 Tax=Narcine bancroftii TaxID=1343680 RepID=UPI003831C4DC
MLQSRWGALVTGSPRWEPQSPDLRNTGGAAVQLGGLVTRLLEHRGRCRPDGEPWSLVLRALGPCSALPVVLRGTEGVLQSLANRPSGHRGMPGSTVMSLQTPGDAVFRAPNTLPPGGGAVASSGRKLRGGVGSRCCYGLVGGDHVDRGAYPGGAAGRRHEHLAEEELACPRTRECGSGAAGRGAGGCRRAGCRTQSGTGRTADVLWCLLILPWETGADCHPIYAYQSPLILRRSKEKSPSSANLAELDMFCNPG